jgi:hypothetical protein
MVRFGLIANWLHLGGPEREGAAVSRVAPGKIHQEKSIWN